MHPKALRQVLTFCDFADLVRGFNGLNTLVAQGDSRHGPARSPSRSAARRGLNPPLEGAV